MTDYKSMKNNDLSFGSISESIIHQDLENIFGTLLNTKDNSNMGKFYEFDKYNDKYYIEIKTRRIRHNQYPTLIFGKNKLLKGDEIISNNPDIRIFYLWRCNDGIYGWEHRSSDFYISQMGRWDRGKREISDCVNVKQSDIKPLNNLIN